MKAGLLLFVLVAGFMQLSCVSSGSTAHAAQNSNELYERAIAEFKAHRYQKAFLLLEPLAKEGHARAQFKLGVLYDRGWGVNRDLDEAAKWYRAAAESGIPKAQYNLAHLYLDRIFAGSKDPKDGREAFTWFQAAAKSGMKEAEAAIGTMYWGGYGVDKDLNAARWWMERAAEKGSDIALRALGLMYRLGEGVSSDFEKSARYFQQASELGNADATYFLGLQYQQGLGVPKDAHKAMALIAQAAEHGSVDAWFGMFEIYAYGLLGQDADSEKAMGWLKKYCRAQTRQSYQDCMEFNLFKGPPEGLVRHRRGSRVSNGHKGDSGHP